MIKYKCIVTLALAILLSGCAVNGPIKLGAGTIIQANSDIEYRQDNNWVYDSGRSMVNAKSLAGQHCDSLTVYTDGVEYVNRLEGVNCHFPLKVIAGGEGFAPQTYTPTGKETCTTATSNGYTTVTCK